MNTAPKLQWMNNPFTHPNVGLMVDGFVCVAWLDESEEQPGGSSWSQTNTGLTYTNCHNTWERIGFYKHIREQGGHIGY